MEKYFARLFMYPPQNKTYEKEIGLHSYKYTAFYDEEAQASAKGMELLEEAYKDIKAGKIKFNWHYGFDIDRVRLDKDNHRITYVYAGIPTEVLCAMVIVEMKQDGDNIHFQSLSGEIIFDEDLCYVYHPIPKISICRYGLFNYVVCSDGPVIEKRFWFFTKIEKIMDWFYTKYTYNISEQ